jgi:hypothetical protein
MKWRTIKISESTFILAQALQAALVQKGWQAVGSDRTEPPTLGNVVAEGIDRLDATLKKKR